MSYKAYMNDFYFPIIPSIFKNLQEWNLSRFIW